MDPLVIAALVVAAFFAGFIDSQVGGGGLITLPALLAAGVPPHLALGTNKLAATGASSVASWQYIRGGLVPKRAGWTFAWLAGAGSVMGALAVLHLPPSDVRRLLLGVMAGLTIYVLVRPQFGQQEHPERRTAIRWLIMAFAVLAIGFYDGFLGPGTGSFLLMALVAIVGSNFVQAAALGRVANFASNAGALIVFWAMGSVDVALGATMLIGTVSGGFVGSRAAMKGGTKWLRGLFVVAALGLMGRLAWDLWG